ncbi:MAG: EamA family transporter [Spirochaetales bacterium]
MSKKAKFFMLVLLISITEVLYQLGYKYVPESINPIASILVLFTIELIFYTIIAFLMDKSLKIKSKRNYLKTKLPYFFAIAITGIDLGYLLVYKFHGEMSTIFNLATPFEALAVLLIGILGFKEKVDLKVFIGIALSIAGVILIGG